MTLGVGVLTHACGVPTNHDGQLTDLDVAGSGPAKQYCRNVRPVPRHAFILVAGFAHRGTPGTTKAWVNHPPAPTPRQLVIHGGFAVDDGRARRLERRSRRLGFADLRGYLQARSDAGLSTPQLAAELDVSQWTVKQALTWAGVQLPPRAERLARQRRHATQQRLAARAAQLGFADLGAYLADRLLTRGRLLVEVTAELGTHRVTVRRLIDQHGIQRKRRTPGEQAAGKRGRRTQAAAWQARRTERLAELGFQDLATYLQRRHVERGWSVRRMRAELRVGRCWLVAELARLGMR
jgi:hypothetical protein